MSGREKVSAKHSHFLSSTLPLVHASILLFHHLLALFAISSVKFAAFLALGLMLWSGVQAQPALGPDSVITPVHVQPLAHFEEATALAADPAGRLYVTDAGADVVVQLAADGTVLERAGGTGSRGGAFDDPADVDPTNGLAIFVADAGNARIQRFARAFRFLEAIPVSGDADRPVRSTYDREGADAFADGTGRPIAVASTGADELYAIDAAEGHVVQWEPGRRTQRIIGAFDDGPGTLVDPVALALGSEGRLYVADRDRAAVIVYDAFGSFLTTVADGQAADARSLLFVDDALWLVCSDRLLALDVRSHVEGQWAVRLDALLVDAARHRDVTYLLTTDALYRLMN